MSEYYNKLEPTSNPKDTKTNNPIQVNDLKCDIEGVDSIPICEIPINRSPSEKTHDVLAQKNNGLAMLTQKIHHSALHGLHHPRTPMINPCTTPLHPHTLKKA